jgi:hypothetical protein
MIRRDVLTAHLTPFFHIISLLLKTCDIFVPKIPLWIGKDRLALRCVLLNHLMKTVPLKKKSVASAGNRTRNLRAQSPKEPKIKNDHRIGCS